MEIMVISSRVKNRYYLNPRTYLVLIVNLLCTPGIQYTIPNPWMRINSETPITFIIETYPSLPIVIDDFVMLKISNQSNHISKCLQSTLYHTNHSRYLCTRSEPPIALSMW